MNFKTLLFFIFTASRLNAMEPDLSLIKAAQAGDIAQVQHLLEAGVPVEQVDEGGRTALMIAAYYNREQIGQLLLGAGASVNHANKNGWTTLMYVANIGRMTSCLTLIERLLKIPSDAQRERIYCALLCIKESLGYDVYDLFKAPMFRALIEAENREDFQNSVAKREIDKIQNEDIKQRLLIKYGQNNAAQSGWCAIQ